MITDTDTDNTIIIRQLEFDLEKTPSALGSCAGCWSRRASGSYRPDWQRGEGVTTGGMRRPECHLPRAQPASVPGSIRTDRTTRFEMLDWSERLSVNQRANRYIKLASKPDFEDIGCLAGERPKPLSAPWDQNL
jgi:hypothetical protein